MKRALNNLLKNHWFFPACLILIGLLFRLSAFFDWPFGFDQVQILQAVDKISQGNLTLIGPRTGPAQMFTGPLIYYLTTIFYFLGFHYFSLILVTLVIAAVTGIIIYFLMKRYLNQNSALIALSIWAISEFFIRIDQVTWNPNLTLLASSLIFLPLFALMNRKKISRLDYLFVASGGFLAYQAHFSGFLFLVLIFLSFMAKERLKSLGFFFSFYIGFLFSLLPTLIFDYRHQWYNLRGLLNLSHRNELTIRLANWYHLQRSLWPTMENLGGIFSRNFNANSQIAVMVGVFVLFAFLILVWKQKKLSQLFILIWIFAITLMISFYTGDKPGYYFYIQLPAMIMMYVLLINQLKLKYEKLIIGAAIVFFIGSLFFSIEAFNHEGSLSLTNSLKVKSYIEKIVANRPTEQIIYFVPIGQDFGFKYLLANIKTRKTVANRIYLAYPGITNFADKQFHQVQIWRQSLTKAKNNFYFSDDFRVSTPKPIKILRDNYVHQANFSFWLINNKSRIGEMQAYKTKQFKEKFPQYKKLLDRSSRTWIKLGKQTYLFHYASGGLVFLVRFNKFSDIGLISQIKIF